MKNYLLKFILTIFSVLPGAVSGQEAVDYVNPFIGVSTSAESAGVYHGLGKTFPGAAFPFGMVQVSPNTITGGDNGCGYSYEHTSIEGFAFTQMSGVGWYGDLGNLLVMPTSGVLKTVAGQPENTSTGYRSAYLKSSEKVTAGYYSTLLTDYNIRAEATVAEHSGMLRFTFPENKQSRIQIDLARRVGGTSVYQYVQIVDQQTIRGWMKCTPDGGGWGNGAGKANYTVYFYLQFSRPFDRHGYWNATIPENWSRKLEDVTSTPYLQRVSEAAVVRDLPELEGRHIGFFAEYETQKDEIIEVKAGISFVDMQGAERNFRREIASLTFDSVRENARKAWREALGKIKVSGGTEEQKTVFYTALYHTMIDPRTFTDVDGRYWGGDKRPHTADKFTKRTIFSGWDVFRSQFPLQTLINPGIVCDMINSLVTLAEENQTGYYERWEFFNAYSGCMIGNPAISVLADACNKGIRGYDLQKAYQYAVKTSETFGNEDRGYTTGQYSVSNTLEYAYSDWCMAQLAKSLGNEPDARKYSGRAQAYQLIFDPAKGWFRPKNNDGSWLEWPEEGRLSDAYGCIESNLYQQGWFVPHDVDGMVKLMGGKAKVLVDLIGFFRKAPSDFLWNSYYNHANEPVHHVPFLFNRLDAPQLTQYWTRYICSHAYHNKVEGLVGNEDVGQMSAWYVLAASGIHPLCPGDTRFEITSPVFDTVTIRAGNQENTFTIVAHNNSPENVYIDYMLLNGEKYAQSSITYENIVKGGKLELFMKP
ncbi:MAG: GH92 family glycosyl hydrolase [Tannerellaceae bacterium]|jgi:predicted alpha-1,2-mannosidase|nr:GH92 family glycosyl hydrolase [Tannerellaceae bacterium]